MISREAAAKEIPGARRTDGVHFEYEDTPLLRQWVEWRKGVRGRKPRFEQYQIICPEAKADAARRAGERFARGPTIDEAVQAAVVLSTYRERLQSARGESEKAEGMCMVCVDGLAEWSDEMLARLSNSLRRLSAFADYCDMLLSERAKVRGSLSDH